jgi:Astacin (Peptidase family M12A)
MRRAALRTPRTLPPEYRSACRRGLIGSQARVRTLLRRARRRLALPAAPAAPLALGFTLALLAFDSQALAANAVPASRPGWPDKTVPFTICEAFAIGGKPSEYIADMKERGCEVYDEKGKLTTPDALPSSLVDLIKSTVKLWNDTYGDHVKFAEVPKRIANGSTAVFRNAKKAGNCGTQGPPGYRPAQDIKSVWLGTTCGRGKATTTFIIMHELLHVLGFFHEHQRWDREVYIRVVEKPPLPKGDPDAQRRDELHHNWKLNCEPLLGCEKGERLGDPLSDYDFASLMHYGLDGGKHAPTVMLTGDGKALLKKKGLTDKDIGKRERMSADDRFGIERLYPK